MVRGWWVSVSNSSWGRCGGARLSRKVTWWGLSQAGHSDITRANAHWITLLDIIFFFHLFGCAGSQLHHAGALIVHAESLVVACGIQFPNQGSNLGPLHWELGVPGATRDIPEHHFKTPTIYPWPYKFSLIISEFLTRMWSLSMDPCTWFFAFVHVPTGGIPLLVLSPL